jgi:hypothetical protein
MDDLFLSMQGQNVMVVDLCLRQLEADLLREFAETDHTSYLPTVIVNALSQMWIFAVYELLRTWRQRIDDLEREVQKPTASDSRRSSLAGLHYEKQLKDLRMNPDYAKELSEARTRMQPLFKQIEALRMNLAKHEVPKMYGVDAFQPGYGRMDLMSGSISWQIDLGNNSVQIVTRREIADELKNQVIDDGMDFRR